MRVLTKAKVHLKRNGHGVTLHQSLISYHKKAKADQKLRQQELEVKKKELENSQGMMQRMMQHQQQMNQTFLAIAGTAERFLYWGRGG